MSDEPVFVGAFQVTLIPSECISACIFVGEPGVPEIGKGVGVGVGASVGATETTPGVRDIVASGAGVAVGGSP